MSGGDLSGDVAGDFGLGWLSGDLAGDFGLGWLSRDMAGDFGLRRWGGRRYRRRKLSGTNLMDIECPEGPGKVTISEQAHNLATKGMEEVLRAINILHSAKVIKRLVVPRVTT